MWLQTFWHGHNDKSHRDDENLNERDAPLTRGPLGIVGSKLDKESDHEGDE